MYCFDVIRSLTSADRLRAIGVKQVQNITARNSFSTAKNYVAGLFSDAADMFRAPATLYA